jgi:hypothetical protein
MHTLLHVDELLIACSSFEEASRVRQKIEDTLLVTCIVRTTKGLFRFSDPDPARPFEIHHLLHWNFPEEPCGSQRGDASRCVRDVFNALARSTIHCPLHRRIGNHRLGHGVGAAPRGNEIERWMVGVSRSSRNDSAQGAQGVSSRLASECRDPARPYGQALPGQPGQAICGVFRKMSFQCPALMAEIKDLVPWLHENKIRLDVVYIRSEVNLVDASSWQRGLDMWSLQVPTQQELLHLVESTLGSPVCTDPLRLQAECSGSKICHSAPLSSQSSLQRFAPRLATTRYGFGKPAMASTAPSFEKTSSVKVTRHSTPTAPSSRGFKKCSSFHPHTSSCSHREFVSDHIIPE